MNIFQILFFLFIHWFCDFVVQKDIDAKNKWNSLKHLSSHLFDYGLFFTVSFLLAYQLFFVHFINCVTFIAVNIVLHFIVDFFTSKWTHYLWEKKNVHDFFVVIGLDQLIHFICLFGTYFLLK